MARSLTARVAAPYIEPSPQLAICHAAKTFNIRAHLIPTRTSHNPKTVMQKNKILHTILVCAALLATGLNRSHAQTAVWKGPASGGEWNTAANWDLLAAPGAATNVFIGPATNVSYTLPMTAATVGGITNRGTLNINTNGFNTTGIVMNQPGGTNRLFLNNGGVVNVAGNYGFTSNNVVTLAAGGILNITGSLFIGSGVLGGSGSGTVGSTGFMTNNGATLNALATSLNAPNASVSSSCLFVINGGTNNLGNVTINRGSGGNNAPPTLGTDGLVVNSGVTVITNIVFNSNSHMTIDQTGGSVTNLGSFLMKQPTTQRTARFIQSGGLYVNPTTNIIQLAPSASGAIALYQVTGGTNMVGGFQFGDNVPSAGTVTFNVGAPVYVGAGGMISNGLASVTASLNASGRLAASADFTNTVTINLNGGVIDASDAGGVAHNIYSTGVLKTGALTKNGGGTLTLTATNTPSSTTINAGTLAFAIDGSGSAGTVSGSITVASNAVLDVSGLNSLGGFTLASGRTLSGKGSVTGTFVAGAGSIVNPAGSGAQGTLSFATGLAATNANFNYELTDNPSGLIKTNDFISVTGDLSLGGTNNIAVTPVGSLGIGTYKLIAYSGTLFGDLSNLACASGTLTNPPGEIDLIVTSVRPTASLVWRGDGAANLWDTGTSIDWLNGVSLDRFYTGDTNTFNDTATNFTVNIFGIVSPASTSVVLVNATNNYTFTGGGGIGGTTGLTKTNSGTLTMVATNLFTGGVNLNGGTISVASLADDGTPSPLGQSGTIVLDGGTLDYSGANYTWTRSLTLGAAGGAVSTANTLSQGGASVYGGAGALTKNSSGGLTLNNANTYAGATILNAGTLTLNNAASASSNNITLNGGLLTLGVVKPANTLNIAGSAQISGGNSSGNTGIKNVTGSSNVLVTVTGGTTFDLTGDMTAYSGTISLTNGTGNFVRFNGSTGSALATWNLAGNLIDLNVRSGATAINLGALSGVAGSTLTGRGGSSNNGQTTMFIGANGASTLFDGLIRDGFGGAASLTHVVKQGAGTLTLSAANTYTGTTVVSNGVLALTGTGSINTSSTITITAAGVVDVTGRGDSTLVLGSQTLRGDGTVRGSLDSTAGTVSPGAAAAVVGQLTVTNIATLNGTIIMDLNRTNGVLTNDVLSAGSLVYGGTLTVTNRGPNLVAGDRFVLFNGPFSGTFGIVNLPSTSNDGSLNYTWTNKLNLDGSVQVLTAVSSVNQTPTNITTSVSGNTLTLSWPADHTGWRLQSQTNTLNAGLGTVWTDIPGTATSNTYNATLDPANGTVFYRMVYP